MTQRSDYWRTGTRFLVIVALLGLCYQLFSIHSILTLELMFVILAGLGAWLIKSFHLQPAKLNPPYLLLDNEKLERLRELHRRGDG